MSNINKVKALLKDYRAIHARIINNNRQLTNMCKEETRDEAIHGQFLAAMPYDRQPGAPRDNGGETRHFVVQCETIDEEDIKKREIERQRLTSAINKDTTTLQNVNESINSLTLHKRQIIIDRYLGEEEVPWGDIADKIGYTSNWCKDLHSQSLGYMAKSLEMEFVQ